MEQPQNVEEAFAEACAQFRTAPDLFRDEDRLHLYALYKQATAGKAPGYNAKTPRRALLRGAELAAWRSLQDMPSQEAKRLYAKCVADNRRNRETKEPQTPRTRAKTPPQPGARTAICWTRRSTAWTPRPYWLMRAN